MTELAVLIIFGAVAAAFLLWVANNLGGVSVIIALTLIVAAIAAVFKGALSSVRDRLTNRRSR